MGQSISFRHLNVSDGLSHNNIHAATIDKNGFLWIGTAEGLNVFNGHSIRSFFLEKFPQMPSNNIDVLFCDSKNQVWAGSSRGAMFIDVNRQLHPVVLNDTLKQFNVAAIIETKAYGIVIISSRGQFYLNEKSKQWMELDWPPDFFKETIQEVIHFKNDGYLVTGNQRYYLIDYSRQQITDTIHLLNARAAAVLNDDQLLLGNNRGKLIQYSVREKKIIKSFTLEEKKEGQDISINLWRMRKAANEEILIGSQSSGLIRFNYQTGDFVKYTYDPLIPNSGATDLIRDLYCHGNGDVVLMTRNAGLSIFNVNSSSAVHFQSFADSKGLIFSNFINGIAEDQNGM
ncbi:MAG TPA: two-component regulator propeller domain-containing protein, partial [Chitinophagaceae bacterium]|nr:two-component regulator propeller domain-containing protein [Chitinophagaceae bacterium]